jgi:metal transporter CNNM
MADLPVPPSSDGGATGLGSAAAHPLLVAAAALVAKPHRHGDHSDPGDPALPPTVAAIYAAVCVALVLTAGLASGLTLALLPLDELDLALLAQSGTPAERRAAAQVAPLVARRHLLLVTLLLCNAIANEALPIFLDRLLDPVTAVVVSVTVVLVAGEIVPQAVCARHGLSVGAAAAWLVRLLMLLCSPVAWPIGRLLDVLLGGEQKALFRGRAQLKALVDVHGADEGMGGTLSADEVRIIRGALDLTSKTARAAMTPLSAVFAVSEDARLDDALLDAVLASGNSRVPVHRAGDRGRLVGQLLAKELVLVDPGAATPVADLPAGLVRPLPRLPADTPLYDMLRLFEAGGSHVAALVDEQEHHRGGGGAEEGGEGAGRHSDSAGASPPRASSRRLSPTLSSQPRALGIITIEDVIEELLGHEIVDETDVYLDNERRKRVDVGAMTRELPPRLRRLLASGGLTPRVGRLASLTGRRVVWGAGHDFTAAAGGGGHATLHGPQTAAGVVAAAGGGGGRGGAGGGGGGGGGGLDAV